MKKLFILVSLVLTFANFTALAQGRMRERIQEARKEYVLKRVELNTEQQKKFPPIYEDYIKKQDELRKKFRQLRIETNMLSLSDAEIADDLEKMLQLRQQELDLEKEFLNKAKSILNIKQIAEMYKAERDFVKTVLRNLRERGGR
jgi:predicted unusual protein kinase regulating ubiquinone biosynthesis (AarF/ABC1/UbiB family)